MRAKMFLAATLLAVSSSAIAENWINLTESESGNRFLVDTDAFTLGNDGGVQFIGSTFRVAKGDGSGLTEPVAMVIAVETCGKNGGLLQERKFINGEWTTVKTWHWSGDGNRFYDFGGAALCYMLKLRTEKSKQQNDPVRRVPNSMSNV